MRGVLLVAVVAFALGFWLVWRRRGGGLGGYVKPRFGRNMNLPGDRSMSGRWLFGEVVRLGASDATWPQLLTTLNPRSDVAVVGLLGRIRVAYVNDVRGALALIEAGCGEVINGNNEATSVDVLSHVVSRLPALAPIPL